MNTLAQQVRLEQELDDKVVVRSESRLEILRSELAKLGQRLSSADGDLSKLRNLLVALRTRADEVRTAA
jgi:uncharacterized membrane protein